MSYFLAGTSEADIFDGNKLMLTAKTFTESTISLDISEEEIRGGIGNKLFGKYFHTPKFDVKITDAMFRMEYIAKNVGGNIVIGGNVEAVEEIVLGTGLSGVLTGTPVEFNNSGTIGWVSLPGKNAWNEVTFNGKNFTSPIGTAGEKICVKYFKADPSAQVLTIPANIVPQTLRIVLRAQLFYSADDTANIGNSVLAGYIEIEIPKFQLTGKMDISMTATGAATTPLEGTALATGSSGCLTDDSEFAQIKQLITNANWYDNVYALAITDDAIELDSVDTTATLEVIGVTTNGGNIAAIVSDLTFTSSEPSIATVDASGKVTRVAAGDAIITVSITAKNSVIAHADVTVS